MMLSAPHAILSICLAAFSSTAVHADPPVDFALQVRPLFSSKCFACHGPHADARQAGMRLDELAGLLEDEIIVPGDSAASELIIRITESDPQDRMPPPEARHSLSNEEIELITRWVDEGAVWEEHWAFAPPKRVAPPMVQNEAWCRDPIDRFVLARIEAQGLAPQPKADRATLLRRASFDLRGLPPSIDELDTFENDTEPGAFERAVDRMLASDAFGERMASTWLDLARYADTQGYQSDIGRHVWPWRDWVIGAFNEGLPYDEFLTWQLAGDLLPEPTQDMRLATAFNRLHRQTNEGGSIEEEFRAEYVADRVNTFGVAMLGVTTECARCHDHKFDPVTQREYYQLSAFFDNIDECGLLSHFTGAVPTPELGLSTIAQQAAVETLEAQVREEEKSYALLANERRGAFIAWLDELDRTGEPLSIEGLQGHYSLDALDGNKVANIVDAAAPGETADGPELVASPRGSALRMSGDNSVYFPGVGHFTRVDPFTISLFVYVPAFTERAVIIHRSRAWTDAGSQGYQLLIEDGRPSFALIHFWPGDAMCVQGRDAIPTGQWTQLTVTHDGSSRASGLSIYINGKRADVEIVRDNLKRVITGGGPGHLTIGQRFRDRGFTNGLVDDVKIFDRALTPYECAELFDGVALQEIRERDGDLLFDYYISAIDPTMATARKVLHGKRLELARARDGIAGIMTMVEMPTPRETFLLERGQYDQLGERVEPGTPKAIMEFSVQRRNDRLGLAEWLTDPVNPLTARVAVNRLWQTVFGVGLVRSLGNFGSQGAPPTHPALLDALALDLIENGWAVKAMLRRFVTSATYRQSSSVTEQQRQADPENTLLARGPAFRLTAEMIRDAALAASGLLDSTVGGPPVFPYQPMGLWEEKSGKTYPQSTGKALHRRSLYTYWKRTSPPPSMIIFDSTKRDVCVAERGSTATPLQALVLLNDPQYVEAARGLAERAMTLLPNASDEQLVFAFRALTSRRPTPLEREVLASLLTKQLSAFAQDTAAADKLASTGIAPRNEAINSVELAALTTVCSALMSTDAAVMRR